MVEDPYPQERQPSNVTALCGTLPKSPIASIGENFAGVPCIDEGDKISTIYDGSWGRTNAHIQQNTAEETPALTVMDCVQAIHWLTTMKERTSGTVASGTDLACHPTLNADVSKAHRRIKITQDGWRFQLAQVNGEWWHLRHGESPTIWWAGWPPLPLF